jgi:Scaffold protein Nfu/NifU N terminal
MARIKASPTPNPNSLKFTLEEGQFLNAGMVSFRSLSEAMGTPWAEQLFAFGGVANVFAMPLFLTVTKTPDASWDTLYSEVEAVLTAYFVIDRDE